MAQINLNEQARQILKIAEEYGVEQNFFFITTFKRYQVQIGILTDLERTINEEGTLVTKEYVKGPGNLGLQPNYRQREQDGRNADENNHDAA